MCSLKNLDVFLVIIPSYKFVDATKFKIFLNFCRQNIFS